MKNAIKLLNAQSPSEQLWGCRDGEEGEPWRAFLVWRNLPPNERGLMTVVNRTGSDYAEVKIWAERWEWEPRGVAYDCYLQKAIEASRINRLREAYDRHIYAALTMQRAAIQRFEQMANGDVEDISPAVAVKMLVEAIKIERLTLGEPGEIIQNDHLDSDNSARSRVNTLSTENRERIADLIAESRNKKD